MNKLPHYRFLRGYAIDPSFSTKLSTVVANEVVYKLKWEDLEKGPSGEYLEVVDHDPASSCYYTKVDLNDIYCLSQQGLEPSEGNPQFHQQFVYAVVMKVIHQFEKALGRKVHWSSRLVKNTDKSFTEEYIPQLRIYPHAIRQQNAFYSPEKKALLFGYFRSNQKWTGINTPNTAIFTCLSPDIVAHEATHAILDGIHPRFDEPTNADVLAFHEGFADIVALLQRFTFKELVISQLSSSRGKIDSENSVLGEMAIQFGQSKSSSSRSLRNAIGKEDENGKWIPYIPNPNDYATKSECHERGALLVAAIFDTFLNLYNFNVADLLRIASDGTGIMAMGDFPPDLINRLAEEACDIANHLLEVCIRALDFCPPVDITFGEYLRALITADYDYAVEDSNRYRITLLDSFRKFGIIPRNVNTISIESLRWQSPKMTNTLKDFSKHLTDKYKFQFYEIANESNRKEIFEKSAILRKDIHGVVSDWNLQFRDELLNCFGLKLGLIEYQVDGNIYTSNLKKFEVHMVRPIIRTTKSGEKLHLMLIGLHQKAKVIVNNEELKFRGGSVIVIDIINFEIKYIIKKHINSNTRFNRVLNYKMDNDQIDTYPLHIDSLNIDKEPFALIHGL